MRSIAATEFKAECLRLMDEVAATGQAIQITKHRRPVARLVPVPRPAPPFLGDLVGIITLQAKGIDLTRPITPLEEWESER